MRLATGRWSTITRLPTMRKNHQVSVAAPAAMGSGVENYYYDGTGQRVQKSGPGGVVSCAPKLLVRPSTYLALDYPPVLKTLGHATYNKSEANGRPILTCRVCFFLLT